MCLELHGEKGWFTGIWSQCIHWHFFLLCPGKWDSEDTDDYAGPIRNPWKEEASQLHPLRASNSFWYHVHCTALPMTFQNCL